MKNLVQKAAGIMALAICSIVAVAPHALASNGGPGTISFINALKFGRIIFTHSGTRTGTLPSCATATTKWALDVSTPDGHAQLSVLLTAYSLQKPISVIGAGDCSVFGDTESISYFYISD